VGEVHAGRLVTLELEADDASSARERTVEMCEELIANPVIEDYRIDVEEAPAASPAAGT
jgi:phosphoribosylformylglycinamidine synthase